MDCIPLIPLFLPVFEQLRLFEENFGKNRQIAGQ
jgi:hypothetical protein